MALASRKIIKLAVNALSANGFILVSTNETPGDSKEIHMVFQEMDDPQSFLTLELHEARVMEALRARGGKSFAVQELAPGASVKDLRRVVAGGL